MTEVLPATFTKVHFDAAVVAATFDDAVEAVPGVAVLNATVEVDEDAPTTRMKINSLDPLQIRIESGALEDTRRPRQFGSVAASASFARLLLEFRDRVDPAFGAPGLDETISPAESIAWASYCYGRATRLGFSVFKPRYRYDFRNRVGFSDAADAAYESLWSAEDLTWADVVGYCNV